MANDTSARKVKRYSESERAQDFDAATQKALEDIDICQNDIDDLNEKTSEEILIVERKYNQLRKPLFEKRNAIISNIPYFWVTAMMHHPDLVMIIDDSEENCLHHLTKMEVEEFEDIKSGYVIKFYFDENPFFENTCLTKEYHLCAETPSSKSTEIIWKDGCSLGKPVEPGVRAGKKRRYTPRSSFFSWFTDNVDVSTDDIAEIIKDDLWPNPLQYYLVPDGEENGADAQEDDSDSSDIEEVQQQLKTDDTQDTAEGGSSA